jgi:phosphomannomutase/phosphoglucomutase
MTTLKIPPSIFREYDIRGIAGRDLSPEFAECLGLAYSRHIAGRKPVAGRKRLTVSVGRDCRLTSDSYAESLIRGLRAGGLDVISLGVCPSPLTYFSVHSLDLDGGIMVTGSHNPGDYNGFKISVARDTLHGQEIQVLRGLMETLASGEPGTVAAATRPHPTQQAGDLRSVEIIPLYLDYLVKIARPLKPMKIVLDAGNGTASTVAPELFKRLGAEVIPLFCELDGRFPNHHPDPTVPANLKHLVDAVRSNGADFGVGFDGDSDRIGLVDETGRIVFGDELMVLFARDVLKDHPGATVIAEVKSSHRLYADIAARGGQGVMWKAGHSLIKSKMKETRALLAGEMSGHIFFADRYFGFDDAIYAAMRVYEIASQLSGPLSSAISDLPPSFATPEIRVECQDERKFALVEETKRLLVSTGKYRINDIDGVRIDFSDGWGLVRASNTQPVLVLRFEASSEDRMNEHREVIENALQKAADNLGHPRIATKS